MSLIVVVFDETGDGEVLAASIAQWLEHWSSKPGVGSSILPGGSVCDDARFESTSHSRHNTFANYQH